MILCVFYLCGCGCKHNWKDATCLDAKTCTECGETEGEPLGHEWKDATCTDPKTCKVCGETEGDALGHDWEDATCTKPEICSLCGGTGGDSLGHEWIAATYSTPKTCSICGETEGTVLEMPLYENMPTGLSVNETEWENWESTNKCNIFPFWSAGEKVNYTYTIPENSDENHKECKFVFTDNDSTRTLKDVVFYYGVENQRILYVGLYTDDTEIYMNSDFKEACIRMMLSYNIHYDSETEDSVLNLTRERAEEIVSFCFDNEIEHCIVDDMRIRLIRDLEDDYYSFHIEY